MARSVAAAGFCVLLLAAVLLTTGNGDGPAAAVRRNELVAAGTAGNLKKETGEQLLLDGVEQVAKTKKMMEVRARTLARRIRSLTRAVKAEETSLKSHGAKVKMSQLQDFKSGVDGIEAAFKRVSSLAKITATGGKEHFTLPAKIQAQQKKLLDAALMMVDKATMDDKAAGLKRSATQKDEAAYNKALIKAATSNADLQRARAKKAHRQADALLLAKETHLLKARERREALEQLAAARRTKEENTALSLQRNIDKTITSAVNDAQHDLATKTPKRPSKSTVMHWASAAKAAVKGDTRTVHAFCNKQGDSQDCVEALTRQAAAKKPCNPEMPGYYSCLGVKSTGGTLD